MIYCSTYHSNGVTVEHFVSIHDNVVRYVGQNVDHRNDGHGDTDGQGQVSAMQNVKVFFFKMAGAGKSKWRRHTTTCTSLGFWFPLWWSWVYPSQSRNTGPSTGPGPCHQGSAWSLWRNLQSSGQNLSETQTSEHTATTLTNLWHRLLKKAQFLPTLSQFDHPCDDDDNESQDLGHGADHLKNGAPFDFHGVDKGQQAWLNQRKNSSTASLVEMELAQSE